MARHRLTIEQYVHGILDGNRAVLSQAITLVESTRADDAALAAELLLNLQKNAGRSFRLGITGVPGVGKSTFIDAFGMHVVEQGRKVAVLAIDPSSQITQGSILGDKTRMERLSRCPQAYIRPSPARGSLGGVARATREAILLCEAAEFDFIIVETVGVGQSETTVHSMVDFFLLLMLAGAGDELQGIKKGIMEMADGVVINKADGDNQLKARQARAEYQKALHLFPLAESGWQVPVLTASALAGEGLDKVWETLQTYQNDMAARGYLAEKRKEQAKTWMHETISYLLGQSFYQQQEIKLALERFENEVSRGEMPPTVAASKLIALYLQALGQRPGGL